MRGMQFKLFFTHRVTDIFNDNIDIHIILSNDDVYVATLFTLKNIDMLMRRDDASYFWASDMIIVPDLSHLTIRKAIQEALDDGYFENACSKIGTVKTVFDYEGWQSYSNVDKTYI
ncbi:hypothetical protein DFQ12_2118 [Sphingobacterium detergens]|uniref:Immunity protein 8 of polymorphic toxin system n=2 Tax=Sphingobacterium detergens TaxID=1145106 RepID=A0A420BKN2_SPHD1|nr:hypothetical protein DFQ12_2118 [Sphingobacterium detergens]